LYSSTLFTHRILWFRDPVQNIISLSHKTWCENCGGFENKFKTLELMYQSFYTSQLTPAFDAVIFEPDFYSASFQPLLHNLMLAGDVAAAKRLAAISKGRVKPLCFGNFHGQIVAPIRRPMYCYAVQAASKLTPTLFWHFNKELAQCTRDDTFAAQRYCLVPPKANATILKINAANMLPKERQEFC